LSSRPISLGIQRERLKTKRSLTTANSENAHEVKAKMEQLIKGLDAAIAMATTPALVTHLEFLKSQASGIRGKAEEVIANSRTQEAIADAEHREQKTVPFKPRPDWRPGGDNVR
jgi:hypothetical protein